MRSFVVLRLRRRSTSVCMSAKGKSVRQAALSVFLSRFAALVTTGCLVYMLCSRTDYHKYFLFLSLSSCRSVVFVESLFGGVLNLTHTAHNNR